MKKLTALVLAVICMLGIASCNQHDDVSHCDDDVLHCGLNAKIVKIDTENQIVYVTDFEPNQFFGEIFAIDCKNLISDQKLFHVDYKTQDLKYIDVTDLTVGDTVILNAYDSQLEQSGIAEVEQIQLATQNN